VRSPTHFLFYIAAAPYDGGDTPAERLCMANQSVKNPGDCRLLVVDDEEAICGFLAEALGTRYHVDTALTAGRAISLIEESDYDVVITDLRLPDMSGMEVLRVAKDRDELTEVIVVTGYASLESAAEAINRGVASYLIKPLQLDNLLAQVERAVSARLFHLRSLHLIRRPEGVSPEIQDHLHDITALYYFSRKLMLALDVPETMRIILDEANVRLEAQFSVIGIDYLQFTELYAMPRHGHLEKEAVRDVVLTQWDALPEVVDKTRVEQNDVSLTLFAGKRGAVDVSIAAAQPYSLPLSVLGRRIGFLALFGSPAMTPTPTKVQFLHVFGSMISLIIEHAYLDTQAKMLAKTDSLTGIGNHRMFHETLEKEIARANRHDHRFCLALIDIDDFKKVNDTYGHLIGDAVLRHLTRRIAGVIRLGDVVARYGGEEFALILPDTDLAGGRVLAERVLKAVAREPFVLSRHRLRCTVSIGIAEYGHERVRDKDELISGADAALYQSKRSGKNRVTME
jgi:diguanylate cyclase (GGDEF)-like protein